MRKYYFGCWCVAGVGVLALVFSEGIDVDLWYLYLHNVSLVANLPRIFEQIFGHDLVNRELNNHIQNKTIVETQSLVEAMLLLVQLLFVLIMHRTIAQ